MKTYIQRSVELVVAFYAELVNNYDEDDDFEEPQLTQARKCALMHLDLAETKDLGIYGFISDDEKWKI